MRTADDTEITEEIDKEINKDQRHKQREKKILYRTLSKKYRETELPAPCGGPGFFVPVARIP